MTKVHRLGVLLAGLWLLPMEPAWAAFHLVMVTEVFPGYPSSPNAQYVELQMYSPGQNFVLGYSVQVFDATGGLIGTFTFDSHAANGADQASLLIATAEAQSLFGVTADLVMTPLIAPAGGKVCFTGSSDCVSWGAYAGSTVGVGNPFRPAGLTLGESAQRRLDRGSPATLDPSDDTNDSATDFVAAPPTPRNNGNATGQPPPTPLSFFTVVPCRVVDTRTGGGPVAAGVDRTFAIAPACGVPATARAVSLNVTVTEPTQTGNVRLFPAGGAVPLASTLNYVAGQTRANNAVIGISDSSQLTVRCAPAGSTHLILDVNGYFE